MDTKDFSKAIKDKRIKKGLSQTQLGELLNVSNKTVSKWETGRGYPDITLLAKLTTTLDLSYEQLLESNEFLIAKKKKKQRKIIVSLICCAIVVIIGYLMVDYSRKLKYMSIPNNHIERLCSDYYLEGTINIIHRANDYTTATPSQKINTKLLILLNDYLNINSLKEIKKIDVINESVPDDYYLDEDLLNDDRYVLYIKQKNHDTNDLIITILDNNQIAIRDYMNNQAIIYQTDAINSALKDIDVFDEIYN